MEKKPDYTTRHTPPGRKQRGEYWSAPHNSRREIDMAIGAYMALKTCSEEQARDALIRAARGAGVGLGAVSQALLARIGEPDVGAHSDPASIYWEQSLG